MANRPFLEPEQTTWQKAGWTREPRNGHEWKLLRAGKAQPLERDTRWKKVFRCRKNVSHKTYKVVHQDGKDVRRCDICSKVRQKRFYDAHKDRHREWSKASRKRNREFVPVLEDGYYTVSASWVSSFPVRLAEMVADGSKVVVEVFGEPAYMIVRIP